MRDLSLATRQTKLWVPKALAFGMLLLLAHSEASAKEMKNSPAKVEPIPGSDVSLVTLIEPAIQRLGIETAPVRELQLPRRGMAGASPELRKVIAYSAVIYDTTGRAWAYTTSGPLVYFRQPISIDYSEGDMTVLLTGPPAGTQVVVVGAAELYGAETGVK
jgi:hypothetical protein